MSKERDWIRIKDFDVQIIRTNRKKSASLIIEYGQLQLIVPETYPDAEIHSILQKKRGWIFKNLDEQKKIVQPKQKEYISGECFTYLGKNYKLKIKANKNPSVELIDGYFYVNVAENLIDAPTFIKNLLVNWYINQAQVMLAEKTERYSKVIGVNPQTIKINNFKSRWGSCNQNGHIQYNWKIVMAPHHIIDYVVVHELCHLIHHNHSSKFWEIVACHMPDFIEKKEWLQVNGASLGF